MDDNQKNPNLRGVWILDTEPATSSGKYSHYSRIGRIGIRVEGTLTGEFADTPKYKELFGFATPLVNPALFKYNYSTGAGLSYLHKEYDRLIASLQGRNNNTLPDYVIIQYDFLLPQVNSDKVEAYEEPRGIPCHILLNQTLEYVTSSIIEPDIYQVQKITFFILIEELRYKTDETLKILEKKPEVYFDRVMSAKATRLAKRYQDLQRVVPSLEKEVASGARSADDQLLKKTKAEFQRVGETVKTFAEFRKVYKGRDTINEYFDINIITIPDANLTMDWEVVLEKVKQLYIDRVHDMLPTGLD